MVNGNGEWPAKTRLEIHQPRSIYHLPFTNHSLFTTYPVRRRADAEGCDALKVATDEGVFAVQQRLAAANFHEDHSVRATQDAITWLNYLVRVHCETPETFLRHRRNTTRASFLR